MTLTRRGLTRLSTGCLPRHPSAVSRAALAGARCATGWGAAVGSSAVAVGAHAPHSPPTTCRDRQLHPAVGGGVLPQAQPHPHGHGRGRVRVRKGAPAPPPPRQTSQFAALGPPHASDHLARSPTRCCPRCSKAGGPAEHAVRACCCAPPQPPGARGHPTLRAAGAGEGRPPQPVHRWHAHATGGGCCAGMRGARWGAAVGVRAQPPPLLSHPSSKPAAQPAAGPCKCMSCHSHA